MTIYVLKLSSPPLAPDINYATLYINMDNPPNIAEVTINPEIPAPKPAVITEIISAEQASVAWRAGEKNRLEQFRLAQQAGLDTSEFTQPIPKPEGLTKMEQLNALSSEARITCDKAFRTGVQPKDSKDFEALLSKLTADTPATPERVIQAGAVIENISYYRRNPNKAGEVLEKNPEALYLPNVQSTLQDIVLELTRSVDNLLNAAHTKPDSPQDSTRLLELATAETSPLEKGLKDQLRDTLDLVRGARTQQFVDGLVDPDIMEPKAALLKESHLTMISKIIGVTLDQSSLQDVLGQHRKLLADRKVISSDYTPDLSRTNFGEALAALSQRTEDPAQKRHLEALALGYATGIKFDPEYNKSEKAGSVLMALVLDTKDPEARAYIAVEEAGKKYGDVLAKLIPMIFNDVLNYSTERSTNSLFDIQNRAALDVRDKRQDSEKARVLAEKVKADELVAQAKAEADRLTAEANANAAIPIKEPATVITPAKKSLFGKLLGR